VDLLASRSLTLETASAAWEQLTAYAGRFLAAWEADGLPPDISQFLPVDPPALRRLVLVELIKIDLEQRLQAGADVKPVEHYAAEFPELGGVDNLPCDLIYEEYHARHEAGQAVSYDDYVQRFPRQAEPLRRLFGFRSTRVMTKSVAEGQAIEFEPGEVLDDFEILARLGEGAFAKVYLARQKSMQRRVAVKISARDSDEPQTMAQLDHPNIVRVFDQRHLADRDLHLVYMEFVSGGSLQALLDRARRTPPALRSGQLLIDVVDRALEQLGEPQPAAWREQVARLSWSETVCWLGAQLAGALDYAHKHQTLHRDLKPANVLLSSEGVPKLVDFNMAYSGQLEGASPAAFFGGTLGYMSPEHLEAYSPHHERSPATLDGQCDLYALGVILWELLTGSRPFADALVDGDWETTLEEMIARRRAGLAPEVLKQLPGDMPLGLRETLLRCLAPQQRDRFATAGQMARELALCLRPEVCRARQRRLGKWVRWGTAQPLLAVALLGLLPNIVVSAANVTYDWFAIVAPRLPVDGKWAFVVSITLFKGVLYAAGIAAAVALALPAFRPLWRPSPPAEVVRARRVTLRLGVIVFWVTVLAWGTSGLLFPAWIDFCGGGMHLRDYVHFFASHTLCGFVAGGLSFFLTSLVAARLLYPRLLDLAPPEPGEAEPLITLRERLIGAVRTAVVTPFVAAIALGLGDRDFQGGFAGLAVLRLGSLLFTFRLLREIQADLDALIVAVRPDSPLAGIATTSASRSSTRGRLGD